MNDKNSTTTIISIIFAIYGLYVATHATIGLVRILAVGYVIAGVVYGVIEILDRISAKRIEEEEKKNQK
jgi:hypothetical protein